MKTRLDKLLVERGLTPSRERAQALILAGKVLVNEQKIEKAGASIDSGSSLAPAGRGSPLRQPRRAQVGEGARTLARSISDGKVCLDVGASTGGFSDCMLQHGAAKVIAVDTGYGQMDFGLRNDPRIRLLEKTNARYLEAGDIGEPIDFIAMDVSFISATLVLPAVIRAACVCIDRLPADRQIVVLVKPQFEVGRELVGKGGIVRDESAQRAAVARVEAALTGTRRACAPNGSSRRSLWRRRQSRIPAPRGVFAARHSADSVQSEFRLQRKTREGSTKSEEHVRFSPRSNPPEDGRHHFEAGPSRTVRSVARA